jgi:hypothetical protein
MREFTETKNDRSPGHVTCRCKNHKNLRWFMKDPRGAADRISTNIGLHFEGDLDSKLPACPFQKPRDREYVAHMKKAGFSHECLCDFRDLQWWNSNTKRWINV